MINLNIITPVTRPVNIPAMYHDIERACNEKLVIRWWLIWPDSLKKPGLEWQEKFTNISNKFLSIQIIISPMSQEPVKEGVNHVLQELEDSASLLWEIGKDFVYHANDENAHVDLSFMSCVCNYPDDYAGIDGIVIGIGHEKFMAYRISTISGMRVDEKGIDEYKKKLLKNNFDCFSFDGNP